MQTQILWINELSDSTYKVPSDNDWKKCALIVKCPTYASVLAHTHTYTNTHIHSHTHKTSDNHKETRHSEGDQEKNISSIVISSRPQIWELAKENLNKYII